MFSPLTETHKNRIVHFFHEDMNSSIIAIIKNVSRRIIEKIRTNLKTFEIHISSKLKKMNKSIKMTSTMQTELKFFLKIKSWTYLKKMKLYLFDDFNVVVFAFTISDCFKYQMKINRQIMKKKFWKNHKSVATFICFASTNSIVINWCFWTKMLLMSISWIENTIDYHLKFFLQ